MMQNEKELINKMMKVRQQMLNDFNYNINLICSSCIYSCYNKNKNKNDCYIPIRELYDKEYALND